MERLAVVITLMTLASLGASGARASGDDGWYLSAGYGTAPRLFLRSDLNDALVEESGSSTPLALGSTSVSRHGSTYSVGVGYWFAENLAIEAAYLHMGKVQYHAAGSVRISGTTRDTNLELHAKSRGGTLAMVWMAPLWNAWGAELRAGAYLGKTNTQYVSTIGESVTSESLAKKSTAPLLGVGGSYAASAHLVFKLEYAHFFGIKEGALNDKFAADVVTLGLTCVF
jgi:opacity protein-like surface antigen